MRYAESDTGKQFFFKARGLTVTALTLLSHIMISCVPQGQTVPGTTEGGQGTNPTSTVSSNVPDNQGWGKSASKNLAVEAIADKTLQVELSPTTAAIILTKNMTGVSQEFTKIAVEVPEGAFSKKGSIALSEGLNLSATIDPSIFGPVVANAMGPTILIDGDDGLLSGPITVRMPVPADYNLLGDTGLLAVAALYQEGLTYVAELITGSDVTRTLNGIEFRTKKFGGFQPVKVKGPITSYKTATPTTVASIRKASGSDPASTPNATPSQSGVCTGVSDGTKISRTRYKINVVNNGSACESEIQDAICTGGMVGKFSGQYTFESCTAQVAPPTSLSYSTENATYTRGVPINPNSPTLSGGPATSYSVSPTLPAGLTLNTSNGVMSGTPSEVRTLGNYTVTASNSEGTVSKAISITVIDTAPASLSYGQQSATYTKGVAITPNVPTTSGGVATSYSISPSLPTGLVINSNTGVISGTPTVVSSLKNYTISATNPIGGVTSTLQISIADSPPSNLSYENTVSTYTINSSIPLNSPYNMGGIITIFTISPQLPSGLSLNSSNGKISGTPVELAPRASYTVTGSNASGSATATIQIEVQDIAPSNLTYSNKFIYYSSGKAMDPMTPTNSGGSIVSFSIDPTLPTGITLDKSTGVISGIPTGVSNRKSYTITGVNSGGSTTTSIEIGVDASSLIYSDITTPNRTCTMRMPLDAGYGKELQQLYLYGMGCTAGSSRTHWYVIKSKDSGQTWEQSDIYDKASAYPKSVFLTPDANGRIYSIGYDTEGTNSTSRWIVRTSSISENLDSWSTLDAFQVSSGQTAMGYDVLSSNDGYIYAIGFGRYSNVTTGWHLRRSSNYGGTWQLYSLPSDMGDARKISIYNDELYVISNLSINGTSPLQVHWKIHRSKDKGVTWQLLDSYSENVNQSPYDLKVSTDGVIFVTGMIANVLTPSSQQYPVIRISRDGVNWSTHIITEKRGLGSSIVIDDEQRVFVFTNYDDGTWALWRSSTLNYSKWEKVNSGSGAVGRGSLISNGRIAVQVQTSNTAGFLRIFTP